MTTEIAKRTQTAMTLRDLAESPGYRNRFNELLKQRAPQFVASLIQLVNGSRKLQQCEPRSVIAAAVTAAALDLPIDKNLGFAHIVPYSGQAQFQMGYKGFVQLAIRTGQYKFLNACPVCDGELISCDKLTGEIVLDTTKRTSPLVIGYAAYFELVNGYRHAEFWTREEVEQHARQYSQAYKSGGDTPWKTDFDSMALKTVIKDLLSHWGIMSIEMQTAVTRDQSVAVTLDSPPTFPDNQPKSPDFKEPPQIKDNAQDDDADLGPQPELPVEPSKQSDSKTAEVTAIEELQKVCEEKGITPEQALKFAISRKLAGETTKTILQLTPQAVGKLTKVIGSNARLVEEIKKL